MSSARSQALRAAPSWLGSVPTGSIPAGSAAEVTPGDSLVALRGTRPPVSPWAGCPQGDAALWEALRAQMGLLGLKPTPLVEMPPQPTPICCWQPPDGNQPGGGGGGSFWRSSCRQVINGHSQSSGLVPSDKMTIQPRCGGTHHASLSSHQIRAALDQPHPSSSLLPPPPTLCFHPAGSPSQRSVRGEKSQG